MLEQIGRQLGGLELLFYTWDQSDPKHFLVAAEVEGSTTTESWQKGLLSLQRRHPMLTVGICHTEESIVFSPSSDTIPFEIRSYTLKTNIQVELQRELARPVRTFSGPLLRVVLYHNDERCFLILAAHHSIADGLSLVYLVNDLLKSITETNLDELPAEPSMDELLGKANSSLGRKALSQLSSERLSAYVSARKVPEPEVDVITFSKKLTEGIISRSRTEETSVHAVLQAAAIEAIRSLAPESGEPVRVMSPISSRDFLGVSEQCGLYTIATTLSFANTETNTFWNLARRAKEELRPSFLLSSLEEYTDRTNTLVSNVDDLVGFMDENLNFEIMLSNLGRYPFGTVYGSLKLINMYGPIIITGAGPKQSLGVITIDGRLTLTNSSRYLKPTLLKDIKQRLTEECL
jgi:hypothetical protein